MNAIVTKPYEGERIHWPQQARIQEPRDHKHPIH